MNSILPPGNDLISAMIWNIKSGGFSAYEPALPIPERGPLILETVSSIREVNNTDTVCLTDAYRWDETYGGESGIASHLGFASSRFVRLQDERLDKEGGAGIGIAFATNKAIESSAPLDLDTRQGLGVILDVGTCGLQLANVYLDDLSEDVRRRQTRALLDALEPDIPTLLVGDFNALRPNMNGATISVKAKDVAVRMLGLVLSKKSTIGITVKEMNKRELVPSIESYGYQDADRLHKRPTAPSRLPIFGVDYAFANSGVTIDEYHVCPYNAASDHRPITFTATIK